MNHRMPKVATLMFGRGAGMSIAASAIVLLGAIAIAAVQEQRRLFPPLSEKEEREARELARTHAYDVQAAREIVHDRKMRLARAVPVGRAVDVAPDLVPGIRPHVGWDLAMDAPPFVPRGAVKGSERIYWNGTLIGPKSALAQEEADARTEPEERNEARRDRGESMNDTDYQKLLDGPPPTEFLVMAFGTFDVFGPLTFDRAAAEDCVKSANETVTKAIAIETHAGFDQAGAWVRSVLGSARLEARKDGLYAFDAKWSVKRLRDVVAHGLYPTGIFNTNGRDAGRMVVANISSIALTNTPISGCTRPFLEPPAPAVPAVETLSVVAPYAMSVHAARLEDAVRTLFAESIATSPPAVDGYKISLKRATLSALWIATAGWTAVPGTPPDPTIQSAAEVPAKRLLGYRVRRQTREHGVEYLDFLYAWVPAGLRSARALRWAPNEEGRGYATAKAKENGGRVVRSMRAQQRDATAEVRALENRLTSTNARVAQLEEQLGTRGGAEHILKQVRYELGLGPDDAVCYPVRRAVMKAKAHDAAAADTPGICARLRADGWVVAVHNDYRKAGEPHTYWRFSKEGRCVNGEGKTDWEALAEIEKKVGALK